MKQKYYRFDNRTVHWPGTSTTVQALGWRPGGPLDRGARGRDKSFPWSQIGGSVVRFVNTSSLFFDTIRLTCVSSIKESWHRCWKIESCCPTHCIGSKHGSVNGSQITCEPLAMELQIQVGALPFHRMAVVQEPLRRVTSAATKSESMFSKPVVLGLGTLLYPIIRNHHHASFS